MAYPSSPTTFYDFRWNTVLNSGAAYTDYITLPRSESERRVDQQDDGRGLVVKVKHKK